MQSQLSKFLSLRFLLLSATYYCSLALLPLSLPLPGNLLYSVLIQVHTSFTHFLLVLLSHIPLASMYNL